MRKILYISTNLLSWLVLGLAGYLNAADPVTHLIVVVGAEGTPEYGQQFRESADQWQRLGAAQHWQYVEVSPQASSGQQSHRDQVSDAIIQAAESDPKQLWVVFIGHGTSERGQHKFNLVGPDVSSKELSSWFQPIECPLIFIDCTSSSSPFLPELSKAGRVIVTATKSGSENNFARFGQQLATSLLDPATDIDHDDEVSLLEAFLAASLKTEKLYKELSRLATEHALIDDNGDKLGTGAEFFRGVRTVKTAAGGKQPDGAIAAKIVLSVLPGGPSLSADQLAKRAEIESQIDALRAKRTNPPTEEYWNELEKLLLQLTDVYTSASETQKAAGL